MTMPPFAVRLATEEELPRAVDIVNEAFAAAYSHVRPPNAPPPRTTLEKVSIAMQQYVRIAPFKMYTCTCITPYKS